VYTALCSLSYNHLFYNNLSYAYFVLQDGENFICPIHHLSDTSFVQRLICPTIICPTIIFLQSVVLYSICPTHHLSYTSFVPHIICPTHHLSHTSFGLGRVRGPSAAAFYMLNNVLSLKKKFARLSHF